jgi:hypothetical protein
MNPNKRKGESFIVIVLPDKIITVFSDEPFSPKITIAGSIRSGRSLYSIIDLPDPLGKVGIDIRKNGSVLSD